jgi:hypothetical protein
MFARWFGLLMIKFILKPRLLPALLAYYDENFVFEVVCVHIKIDERL